jgi:hypothetical protein
MRCDKEGKIQKKDRGKILGLFVLIIFHENEISTIEYSVISVISHVFMLKIKAFPKVLFVLKVYGNVFNYPVQGR